MIIRIILALILVFAVGSLSACGSNDAAGDTGGGDSGDAGGSE